jgi:hypothetical protein
LGPVTKKLSKEHQKLGGLGEFGPTKTFANILKKLLSNFFEKTQKKDFLSYSVPIFFLA